MSNFPSPVGGNMVRDDFAPSVIFAILYGLLVPLAGFRLLGKRSRTTLLIGTILFSIERVVIFSLRAIQSRNQAKAQSHGIASYEQLTIGMGYIGISQDLVNFLRVLLVNTSHPDPSCGHRDDPERRKTYRSLSNILNLAFISAIVPGIISGLNYSDGIDHPDTARLVMRLRYASSGVTLILTAAIGIVAFVALRKIQRVQPKPAYILVTLSILLSTVAIYRLSIMHNNTDSLLSRAQGSLSSPTAKLLFYIFHMLPEWLASVVLLGLNVREVFASGPFGDWRSSDAETERERKKRERKERKERKDREIAGIGQDDAIVLSGV